MSIPGAAANPCLQIFLSCGSALTPGMDQQVGSGYNHSDYSCHAEEETPFGWPWTDLGRLVCAARLWLRGLVSGGVRGLQADHHDIDGPAHGGAVHDWDLLSALDLDARIVHSAALQR